MKKILLIDDDKGILELYSMFFSLSPRRENYQFFNALTIEEGRNIIEQQKPDLILLDLILPKIFEPHSYADIKREELNKEVGFNFLRELKENPDTKDIPVVIFSNLSSVQDKERAQTLGAKGYLVKSDVVQSQVLEIIQKILE